MILKVPKKKAIREILYNRTQPTFYNNYKWNITFKKHSSFFNQNYEKLFLYTNLDLLIIS